MDELRRTADTRPGYATYPDSRPGTPSWWQRHGQQPPARPAPAARPWTGPEPLMAFGPPMILAPVDDHDDEPVATSGGVIPSGGPGDDRVHITPGGCLGLRPAMPEIKPAPEPEPEPRRWWHRIARGMA